MTQHLNRPMRFQRLGQPIHQGVERTITIVLLELGPLLALAGAFQPSNKIVSIQRPLGIVLGGFANLPALCLQLGNDVALEVLLLVCGVAHADSRRSIWPVTAAVMKAERRSLMRLIEFETRCSIASNF